MKPVFFPYTYISDDLADTMAAFFKKITMYLPTPRHIDESVSRYRDAGWLEIRMPAAPFESQIESGLKSARAFGELHGRRRGEAKHFQSLEAPFAGESALFHIRSELARKLKETENAGDENRKQVNRLVQACIFLTLAQDFDRHQAEIGHCLEGFKGLETALYKDLKGEEDPSSPSAATAPPSGDEDQEFFMPLERLAAWTRLFFSELTGGGEPPFFPATPIFLVTHSRAVFDHLCEQAPGNTSYVTLSKDCLDPVDGELAMRLSRLARETDLTGLITDIRSLSAGKHPLIKTAVIAKRTPPELLSAATGVQPKEFSEYSENGRQANTLIGLIESH
jgi:hypothetical protein